MKKFTFILEFRGGTYISQAYGNDLNQAKIGWLKNLSASRIKYLGEKSQEELRNIIKSDSLILLQGMNNVWCISGTLNSGFFVLNVVG